MTVYKYGQDNVDDYIAAEKTYGGLTWETWIIHGRSGNDTLIGGDDNDYLRGEVGDDTLIGRYDNDELEGGAGNDVLYGYTATSGGRSDERDLLDGGEGADTMYGGNGGDTYIVDNVGDRVIEYANEGTDLVKSSLGSYALTESVENLTLTGYALNGYGNALGNEILGNNQANVLYGFSGDDILKGWDGSDYMVGGLGRDNLQGGHGSDTMYADSEGSGDGGGSTIHDILYAGDGIDVLYAGDGQDVLSADYDPMTGNSYNNNDTLFSGTDTIADQLYGGGGDDTYVLRGAATIYEYAGEGTDTIISRTSNSLGHFQHVENLVLDGTAKTASGTNAANKLIGNAVNNSIYGLDGADSLEGRAGFDELYAGDGSDIIRGGNDSDVLVGYSPDKLDYENDTLWGEGGGDRFVLGSTTAAYYIVQGNTDFAYIMDYNHSSGDRIQVFGSSSTLSNYSLNQTKNITGSLTRDTEIYYRGNLIAVVADNYTMTTNEFIFSGQ